MSPVTMAQVTNLGVTQQLAVAQIAIDAESGRPQSARYSRR
jgi:hypothetical protein